MLFFDIETNGFLAELDKMWCLCIAEDQGEIIAYSDHSRSRRPLKEGLARLAAADKVCAHNGLGFDYWAVNMLFPGTLRVDQVVDSLILCRMQDPESKHSLEAIGQRLGFPKDEFKKGDPNRFKTFCEEMVDYCVQDVAVLQKAWLTVADYYAKYGEAYQTEHRVGEVLGRMQQHGFRLDITGARSLERALRNELVVAERQLAFAFPNKVHTRFSEKTGKRLKDRVEVFNPGSRQQIASRLTGKYGWKPNVFTQTGQAQIDEGILNDLAYPEAKLLAQWFRKSKLLGQLIDGDNGWLKLVDKHGYVHGTINQCGTRTHRASHFRPNMAQIDKEPRMRSLWLPDEGHVLVGIDGEGLQLRILAHYLARYDKGAYAKVIDEGKKEDATDIHSFNMRVAGFGLRESAKTLIYALLFGAMENKLGSIARDDQIACGKPQGGNIRAMGSALKARLEAGIPGLRDLNRDLKKLYEIRTGGDMSKPATYKGLDGRPVVAPELRLALVSVIQNAEAVIFKTAIGLFHAKAWGKFRFDYCAWVHDEIQLSVHPDDADAVGKLFAQCLTDAGQQLGVRCPIRGSFDKGANWKETH